MVYMQRLLLAGMLLLNILVPPFLYAENTVSAFEENMAANFSLNYRMGTFSDLRSSEYNTDEPWKVGLGLRYENLSAEVSVSAPLKPFKGWSYNYDFEMDYYFEEIYYEAFFKHYPSLILQISQGNLIFTHPG